MENVANDLDINEVYEQYIASPTQENYELVFVAANRLIEKFVNSTKQIKNKSDLVQSGYLGLIKAINSYNKDAGTKFSTWASTCIISEIHHEIRREQRFFNFKHKEEDDETPGETVAGVVSIMNKDGFSLLEYEADEKAEIATKEHLELKLILECMNDLDRKIVDLLFFKDLSQDEVAKILGISQKKVSRQKAKIVSLLQKEMNSSFKLISNDNSFKLVK